MSTTILYILLLLKCDIQYQIVKEYSEIKLNACFASSLKNLGILLNVHVMFVIISSILGTRIVKYMGNAHVLE